MRMLRVLGEVSFGLSPSSALPAGPLLVRFASPDSLAAPCKQNLLPTPLVDRVPGCSLNSQRTLPQKVAFVLPKFTPSNVSALSTCCSVLGSPHAVSCNFLATFIFTEWSSRRVELRWVVHCTCFSRLIPWPILTLPVSSLRTRTATYSV